MMNASTYRAARARALDDLVAEALHDRARDVPCLTLHGDPRGAHQAVDRLLVIS